MPDPHAPDLHAAPPTAGLAELGARLRGEWRSDEEQWMHAAARRWVHDRTVSDLLLDYGARGDRVSLTVVGRTFEGEVVAVAHDHVELATSCARVLVRTALGGSPALTAPLLVRRAHAARAGGRRLTVGSTSLRARLLGLETRGRAVVIGTVAPAGEHRGAVRVGRDHVVLDGDDALAVPIDWVGYVVVVEAGGSASTAWGGA